MSNGTDTMSAADFQRLVRGEKVTGAGNRKVRNAQKIEQNGVVFDSRVEKYMHDLLVMHNIPFERQKKYTLLEGFDYNGEKVRAITYTVDYELPTHDMVIDTKGVTTQQGQLRIKMLKRLFADLGRQTRIELPKDRDACAELVRRLLDNKTEL